MHHPIAVSATGSALIPFQFENQQVRVVDIDGNPWFVLADICSVLNLNNPSQVASRLDEDALITNEVIDSLGRTQQARMVNEPGLYEVIVTSRSPRAKPFKRWVFEEVLPQIRKTGSYNTPALTDDQIVHQALQITSRKIQELENRVTELEPKAARFDDWLGAEGDYTFTQAAKILGRDHLVDIGGRRLIDLLTDWGWVYRVSGNGRPKNKGPILPYQAQIETGRLTVRARTFADQYTGEMRAAEPQTRVTPKGVHDIAARLKAKAVAA